MALNYWSPPLERYIGAALFSPGPGDARAISKAKGSLRCNIHFFSEGDIGPGVYTITSDGKGIH
jgi:hypothetical protein